VAKRKQAKQKTKRISFKLGASKRKKQPRTINWPSLASILKTIAVVCVLAAGVIGFVLLEKYVRRTVPASQSPATLELVHVPAWVNEQLKEKIYAAARTDGEDLKLDETTAESVQQNIANLVSWLDEVTVQTSHDCLLIEAKWRKPLGLVELGRQKFYIDAKLVVLDFVPMPNLPIVRIKGLSTAKEMPPLGEVWQCEDLVAGVTILAKLDQMDKSVTPDKPLLYEIDSIDVSNFNGRKNSRLPHIILYTEDDTKIIWGAEFGNWQKYLEETDEKKLAKLYSYYKEHGSLLDGAKYINLRDPQDNVPQPIDKY
jgi:hypothetical protein